MEKVIELYGNPEYCKKHGHDWKIYDNMHILGARIYICRICGAKQTRWDKP